MSAFAYKFVKSRSEYLIYDAANPPFNFYPIAFASWTLPRIAPTEELVLISMSDKDVGNHWMTVRLDDDAGTGDANWNLAAGGSASSISTENWKKGRWQHVAGASSGATSHKVLLDGKFKGTAVTNITPLNIDNLTIGAYNPSTGPFDFMNGLIAYPAIWDGVIALADQEIMRLAQGTPPWDIRPGQVTWWEFPNLTSKGKYRITLRRVGNPQAVEIPEIFGPEIVAPAYYQVAAAAAAGKALTIEEFA